MTTTQVRMINSKQKRWLTGGLIFLLTILMLYILRQLFPFTGLGIIVFFPFILLINGGIIVTTIRLTKNMQRLGYITVWTITTILTISITMIIYPQESRPNVFKQMTYSILAILQFEKSPQSDLDLPFTVEDFSRRDSNVKDASERYVVALYKYRNTIPLDGSFHIYREDKRNIVPLFDSEIRDINDIPNKLETGQDKLIWWILEKLKK